MDPETKYALISTLFDKNDTKSDLFDTLKIGGKDTFLANWYSATCLFMEPDPTHRNVLRSWITTNMFPTSTGDIIGKRNLKDDGEVSTLAITFTGISQFNVGSNIYAQKVLDTISTKGANPLLKTAFVKHDATSGVVNANLSTSAYALSTTTNTPTSTGTPAPDATNTVAET